MKYVVDKKIISGKSDSTLNPKDFATRAEMAAILNRIVK